MTNINNIMAEEYINKFHALEGTTIADKRKNFFILQNKTTTDLKNNEEALDFISSNLKPRTFLEELFKLHFLIYFRRTNELFQLLKEGNDIFVSKIIKENWFFEIFFDTESADFVNDVLPSLSYVVRMKVLGKLCRYMDSKNFDQIFDAVVERYGIFVGLKFICGCTPDKIRTIILEYPIKITGTPQLKILYHKEPDLIDFYFTHSNDSLNRSVYGDFIKFLYNKNRKSYDYLREKYHLNLKFGRRMTKKIVDEQKQEILNNPQKINNLNIPAVLRKLGKDSKTLFCNALPIKFEDLNEIQWLLRHFPKKYHYNIYVKVVENHYNVNFIDYPKLIDKSFLALLSDKTERARYAKVRVDNGCDEFIKYLEIQDSISLIKEKINLTSDVYQRRQLIENLVETCYINKDIEALKQVMKYFNFRHKNDDLDVHLKFINNIENLFGFKEFNEEMWNLLNDLLLIHMLKFDKNLDSYQKIQTLPLVKFNLGTSLKQKQSYLDFLFNRGESIDDLLTEYFSVLSDFPRWGCFSKKFEKHFLFFAINRGTSEEDLEKNLDFNGSLIQYIYSWNLHYKQDQLSFYNFPSLVYTFNYYVRQRSYVNSGITEAFRSKIFTNTANVYRDQYLDIYWERLQVHRKKGDLMWFLKYDFHTILKYFKSFFDNAVNLRMSSQISLWYFVRKLSHLQLDATVKTSCIEKLNDENCLDRKPIFVTPLSVLMKPKEYAALADSYKPVNKTLDLKNETDVRLYNLQCSIATNFKNIKSYEVLPSLLNYCAGDYFKYAMTSLYNILYRTPENMLPQYFSILSKKAVSVRKHALYLTCELSTVSKVEEIIKLLNKSEGVQSLQKLIFASTIKYFVKNPKDQFFELVKMNMHFVKKTDDESLSIITQENLHKIPKKYKAAYIQYTWEYLEKTVDIWEKLKPLKQSLLQAMNFIICREIPLEFGVDIIQAHFKSEKELDLNNFIFMFTSSREDRSVIFDKIFVILDRCPHFFTLQFFNSWCHWLMAKKEDINYITPVIIYFQIKINVGKDFVEYVKLFFLKLKMEVSYDCRDLKQISERIYNFLQNLTSNYGPHIISLFGAEMKNALLHFSDKETLVTEYYYSLILNHPCADVAILILGLIFKPSLLKPVRVFNATLQKIKEIDDPGVHIILNHKFKNEISDNSEMEID